MKKGCSLLLLLLSAYLVQAVSVYEIKYTFPNNDGTTTLYTAFLVRYDNRTGFMRVRYYSSSSRSYKVVEMQVEEIEGNTTENGTYYQTLKFQGRSPYFVIGATETYYPDYIWFRKTSTEYYFYPWGATSPNSKGDFNQGKITDVKLLNKSNITQAYAKQFFLTTDIFYTNLFGGYQTSPPAPSYATKGALRVIMIANTNDLEIGGSCAKDARRINEKFKDVASFLNLPYYYTEISGSNFNKSTIQNTIQQLPSASNDVIVVCYSGHGFRYSYDNEHPYPQFDLTTSSTQPLTQNTMNVSEVYNMLGNKSGRLKLILADCCNDSIRISRPGGPATANMRKSMFQWNKRNCEALFLNSSGTIVASAASRGEVAWCNESQGGYFIFNFMESLDKAMSVFETTKSWRDIITETRTSVYSASPFSCDRKTCKQNVISYINLK